MFYDLLPWPSIQSLEGMRSLAGEPLVGTSAGLWVLSLPTHTASCQA